MSTFVSMRQKDKKELIKKVMAAGDKRSYNELVADLELEIHRNKFVHPLDRKKEGEFLTSLKL